MFSFFQHGELTDDNEILSCAHEHKTLTMSSFTVGNISSAICTTILGTLVSRECRIFCNLETSDILWVAKEFAYKNPSDIVFNWKQLSKSVRKQINYDCV
jgi:hypothetical protein